MIRTSGPSYGPLSSGNHAANQIFYYGNTNNADDDAFYGTVWQTGRTYRFTMNVNF